jgi:hypothetical protein
MKQLRLNVNISRYLLIRTADLQDINVEQNDSLLMTQIYRNNTQSLLRISSKFSQKKPIRHDLFAKANKEAMEDIIPKKRRTKKPLSSSDDRVVTARRQKAKEAQCKFEVS